MDGERQNVLHALIRKRAQIAGRIEQLQLDLRDAVADLDSIDAAMVLDVFHEHSLGAEHAGFR